MDYLLLGRVAKGVALLGFLLPWVTVSCSNTVILEATGVQLMTGDIQPSGALAGLEQQQTEDPEPSIAVIAACACIAIGLIAALFTKARAAAIALMIGGGGGAGLSYFAVQNLRTEMARQMDQAQTTQDASSGGFLSVEQERDMSQRVAQAIRVEEEEGFWVTVIGAFLAGLFGLIFIASAGRDPRPDAPA